MNRQQLILSCAIATFTLSTAIGGIAIVSIVSQRAVSFTNQPKIMSLVRVYGLPAGVMGISIAGIGLNIFVYLEAAELKKLIGKDINNRNKEE